MTHPTTRTTQRWASWVATCLWPLHSALFAQPLQPLTEPLAIGTQVEAGFNILLDRQQGNCLTCHTLSKTSLPPNAQKELGLQGNFGPTLDGVGTRYDKATLLQWVSDARKIKPDTLMPPYGSMEGLNHPNAQRPLLTAQQRHAVAAALSTLR
jgi:sulfur-oxidizing protein SoxX